MAVQPKENEKKKVSTRKGKGTVYVIKDRCKECGFCLEYCPVHILEYSRDFNKKGYHYPIVTDEEGCINCKGCENRCPEFAIYSITREKGDKDGGPD